MAREESGALGEGGKKKPVFPPDRGRKTGMDSYNI
jgi:hypothetical protein